MGIFDFFKSKKSIRNDNGLNRYVYHSDEIPYYTEGVKKDGKRDGLWKSYYKSGQLYTEEEYKNDILSGVFKKYRKNGKLLEKGQYKDGVQDGFWETYKEDGITVAKGRTYKKPKRKYTKKSTGSEDIYPKNKEDYLPFELQGLGIKGDIAATSARPNITEQYHITTEVELHAWKYSKYKQRLVKLEEYKMLLEEEEFRLGKENLFKLYFADKEEYEKCAAVSKVFNSPIQKERNSKVREKLVKKLIIKPEIETTLEEFVKDEGLDLDNIIEEIKNDVTYYEPDYYLYSIEKEGNNYVLEFIYDTLSFLESVPYMLEKYNHNLLFFQELQYNGGMIMGDANVGYIEWDYEYSSESSKLDIPRLLFKMQPQPFIVRKNGVWINEEEEKIYDDLIDSIQIDGKYTRNGIINLDELNEENWYQKLQSIGYGYDFPKDKPEEL